MLLTPRCIRPSVSDGRCPDCQRQELPPTDTQRQTILTKISHPVLLGKLLDHRKDLDSVHTKRLGGELEMLQSKQELLVLGLESPDPQLLLLLFVVVVESNSQ